MELKPITISFKNTPDEAALYKILIEHSSKGGFIKDTLIEVLIKKNNISPIMLQDPKDSSEINEIFNL